MPEMKTLNGYEVVDAKAREDIKELLAIDFATETYVDNAIENIPIPEVDLSEHALKSEIPTKVSQLANDKKYITLAEVPEVDLSEYAKKSDIPEGADLSEYAKKSDIPEVPTKTSQLTNDSGFITYKRIEDLASKEYVDQAIASAVFGENVEDLFIHSIQNLEAKLAAVEARLDELEGK